MLLKSQIKVGALKLISVPYSAQCPLAPSSTTPPEELPAAAAECSVANFVTPTGHKAVSLIDAHLKCSHLTDLPISAS